MEFLSAPNILDFENKFISYYRKEVVYNEATFTKDEFLKSLRVFLWFKEDNDFADIRDVCEKTITLLNNDDPLKLGLLHFLNAYVKDGDLDCTQFFCGISNNIPQTVRALANNYKNTMMERFPDVDVSLFSELEAKFNSLENARSFVLSYIGEMGHKHLDELSVCAHFHPSEIEEILYKLAMLDDERTHSEKNEIHKFVVRIVENTELDLVTEQNWMTEYIQYFIKEFETDENNT